MPLIQAYRTAFRGASYAAWDSITPAANYATVVLADSPAVYYRLGEAAGATDGSTMADSSGNGRDGTYTLAPTTGVTGVVSGNTAATFVRANADYATFPTTGLPSGSSAYTLEAWVKPVAFDAQQGIIGIGTDGTTNRANSLRLDASGGIVNYWWGSDLSVNGSSYLNLSSWNHVVATWDGTTRKIYANGALVGQDTPAAPNVLLSSPRVGRTGVTAEYFNGGIDEVAIYTTALSAARVAAHYVAAGGPKWQARGTINSETFTAAVGDYNTEVAADTPSVWYKLQESSGTTAADASGNSRNGTYGGGFTLNQSGLLQTDASTRSVALANGYVDQAYSAWMNSTSATYAAWIRPTTVSGIGQVWDRDQSSRTMQFRVNAGKLEAIAWNTSGTLFSISTAASTIAANTIYHVAMVWTAGSTLAIFINGVLSASTAVTGNLQTGTDPLCLGAARGGLGGGPAVQFFDGRIGDSQLFPTALSSTRLLAHYNAGYAYFQATMDAGEGYSMSLSAMGIDPTNDYEVEISLGTTDYSASMMGPMLHDNTGAGVCLAWYNAPVGALMLSESGYGYPGGFANVGGSPTFPSRLRLGKNSTSYYGQYSTDNGLTWSAATSYGTSSNTLTRIGFGSLYGGGSIRPHEFIVRAFGYNTITTAPTGLAVSAGNTQLTATWNTHADAVTYDVRLNGGTPVTGITSTSYIFTGLTNGTSYTVEVRAVNPTGAGPWSSTVSGTPVSGATTLLTDDFNRANSTTSPNTPVFGGPYTTRSGTWGINANQLYTSASTASSQLTFPAAIDCDVSFTIKTLGGNWGAMVRWVDTLNWWCFGNNSGVYGFYKGIASTTGTDILNTSKTPVIGDVVRLVAYGRLLYGLVNGKVVAVVEDQWYSAATAVAGFRINSSTATRIDDASALTAIAPPAPDGGSAALPTLLQPPATLSTPFLYRGRLTKTDDIAGVS